MRINDLYLKEKLKKHLKEGVLPVKYAYTESAAEKHCNFSHTDNYSSNVDLDIDFFAPIIKHLVGKKIHLVDIGSGDGKRILSIISELTKSGVHLDGFNFIDFSNELLALCKNNTYDELNGKCTYIHKDIEEPFSPILMRREKNQGILFSFLGNTLGNVVDEDIVLQNILYSMQPEDYLIVGITLKKDGYDETIDYSTNLFYESAVEFLRFIGIEKIKKNNFTIVYDGEKERIVANYCLNYDLVDKEDIILHKGTIIECFQSRRYRKKNCIEMFCRNGFDIVENVSDANDCHIVWLLKKNSLILPLLPTITFIQTMNDKLLRIPFESVDYVINILINMSKFSVCHLIIESKYTKTNGEIQGLHKKVINGLYHRSNTIDIKRDIIILSLAGKNYFERNTDFFDLTRNYEKVNIQPRFVAPNSVDSTLLQYINYRDCLFIDRKFCLYFEQDKTTNKLNCILSTCDTDIKRFESIYKQLWEYDFAVNRILRLREPLAESVQVNYDYAIKHCSNDYVDENSCCWYHSSWQFLRIIDKVSSPEWHSSFYSNNLLHEIKKCEAPKILISGTADYSLLAYVVDASKKSGKCVTIDVLDKCPTPLNICNWYNEHYVKSSNVKISLLQRDIFDVNEEENYNLICTDAFLTRFDKSNAKHIINKWFSLLKRNGSVVTTVRINHKAFSSNERSYETSKYINECCKLYEQWEPFFNIGNDDFHSLVFNYVANITSYDLGQKKDVENLFIGEGFSIYYSQERKTPGELFETYYDEIVAKKTL